MYICDGLVLNLPPENKPWNVKCNIFSELTQKASLLFFRLIFLKKLAENFCVISEIWTELCQKNFVLKIHCGKPNFARQIKFAWQWKAENQTLWINVALSFKFRKYKTAFNSGLKIWLVSGIFEMAQLFNLKFWLYLWRLGVGFSPHF